ncbi:MAG: tetratricopeptide repeat protein, partial [Gemmataceae bacterium]
MTESKQRARRLAWLVGLLLGGAVLALYSRACGTELDFINFDDDDYVSNNAHVQQGLTIEGLRWAFTSREEVNWHPLTWLSLQLDSRLFGPAPVGYHRTNVLLHACNTVLLFWLLRRMTGALWCSAGVAAFFGLHPVHVEAVAWVTSRKDVLSTLLWLLTTAAYLGYAKRPTVGRYGLVVLLLALGLMAKQMLVTLPATLLLLDYWPLCRWPDASTATTTTYAPASLRWLLLEKLPLLTLVIPASLLTLWAQQPILHTLSDYTIGDRVSNALVSYLRYLRMAVWPVDLAILYPLPRQTPLWQPLAAFGLLAALTLGLLWASRSRRYLAVGWLWYLGTLFPVIGLVQNGPQGLADRYAYVPYIGLYIIVAWSVAEVCTRDRRQTATALLAATTLACCGVLSWQQLGYWRDSETLWRHALAATTNNYGAHTMLAKTLLDKRKFPEAVKHFEASLRLMPDNVANHGNLAVALGMLGQLDEAADHLERSLQLRPNHAFTHFNLGSIRERQGRLPQALRHYTT